jgi:hypothetical protein
MAPSNNLSEPEHTARAEIPMATQIRGLLGRRKSISAPDLLHRHLADGPQCNYNTVAVSDVLRYEQVYSVYRGRGERRDYSKGEREARAQGETRAPEAISPCWHTVRAPLGFMAEGVRSDNAVRDG